MNEEENLVNNPQIKEKTKWKVRREKFASWIGFLLLFNIVSIIIFGQSLWAVNIIFFTTIPLTFYIYKRYPKLLKISYLLGVCTLWIYSFITLIMLILFKFKSDAEKRLIEITDSVFDNSEEFIKKLHEKPDRDKSLNTK